jgi:hypothetical protein
MLQTHLTYSLKTKRGAAAHGTSTDRLVVGVIGALFAPAARLYQTKAAFGVVIDCVAFATTMEVMMATTVAIRMTPGRENFWIRILIVFTLFGFLFCWFSYVLVFRVAPRC